MVTPVVLVVLVSTWRSSSLGTPVPVAAGACTSDILAPGLGTVHSREHHVLEEFGTEFGRHPLPLCHSLLLLA